MISRKFLILSIKYCQNTLIFFFNILGSNIFTGSFLFESPTVQCEHVLSGSGCLILLPAQTGCSVRVKIYNGSEQLLDSSPTSNMNLKIKKVRIFLFCVSLLFSNSAQCNKKSKTASTSVSRKVPRKYPEVTSGPGESEKYCQYIFSKQ